MILSMDSKGCSRYKSYEYRSAHFTVHTQNSYAQNTETSAAQRSGSFFESSITKNWFSTPHDFDNYGVQSSSSTPVTKLIESMSKRESEPEVMLAHQRAVSPIEVHQTSHSKYVANLESGKPDTLTLDSERADLHYHDTALNEYNGMCVDIKPQMETPQGNGSSAAVTKSENNSSHEFMPRTRTRRVYHM